MTSAPAIGFEYRPSRRLAQFCVFVPLLALAAIALCGLLPAVKMLLALIVVVAAARAWSRHGRSEIAAVGLSQEAGWVLRRTDGTDAAATLASSRVIGPYVLLRMALPGARGETLLLGPDNSDADIRRRLRMRLATAQITPVATDS
jgi:toxin CptA